MTADVGRDETVLEIPEWVIGRERFGVCDVECGPPNFVGLQRRDERVGVDKGAAGRVDEDGVWRERRKFRLTHESAGQVGQRSGENDVLAAREGIVNRVLVEADDFVGRTALCGRVSDADGIHVESFESLGDLLADRTEADDRDSATS